MGPSFGDERLAVAVWPNSKLEWGQGSTLLIVLLLLYFLGKPFYAMMQQRFERTAFEQALRQLSAACDAAVLESMAMGTLSELGKWTNPIDCLEEQSLSTWDYSGVLVAGLQQEAGSWAFDPIAEVFTYRWRDASQLINLDPEQDLIQFKLKADFADENQNGVREANESITGLYLTPLFEYRWVKNSPD